MGFVNDTAEVANSYCNFVMTTTWGQVLFSANIPVCVLTVQPAVAALGLITTEPVCDAELVCNNSGFCAESGSPGTPIEVYDPGCTPGSTDNVKTALGCLPTDPQIFINKATPWAIYLGAGVAFILGVFGALMIVLSAGNPEKMQAGKEMITSAIAGTVILVFAVFILKIIGVDILGLFNNPYD